ncbi:MAG: alpha/beta hydrolase [Candidatus Saccharimonas sp.]
MQQSVIINGHTVQYWVYHPEATQTAVFIHGFTGSHEGFQYIIPLLPTVRCIVLDLPGFGRSDLPPRTHWSVQGLAQLANECVATLALPTPPLLVGHSMGGLVASSMVHQAPQLFAKKIVLISPVPTAIRRNDSRRVGALFGALQYKMGYKVPIFGEKLVKSRRISQAATRLITTTNDHTLRATINSHHLNNLGYISNIEFYSKLHHDINRQGAVDAAAELQKKTVLLITGDADNVTPLKHMNRLAAAITPAQFVVLPGVGHLLHYERPKDVAELMQAFFSAH